MLFLRDLPKYEAIRQRAARYPNIDPRAVESFLVLLRVASDVFDGIDTWTAKHGMSQGKFTVLMILNRDPDQGINPSELAERSGCTRATMTGLLDGLEREGLITRQGDTTDRRKAVVSLTRKAIQLLDSILPDYYAQVAQIMGAIDEDEKQTLVQLLMRINQRVPAWRKAVEDQPDSSPAI